MRRMSWRALFGDGFMSESKFMAFVSLIRIFLFTLAMQCAIIRMTENALWRTLYRLQDEVSPRSHFAALRRHGHDAPRGRGGAECCGDLPPRAQSLADGPGL